MLMRAPLREGAVAMRFAVILAVLALIGVAGVWLFAGRQLVLLLDCIAAGPAETVPWKVSSSISGAPRVGSTEIFGWNRPGSVPMAAATWCASSIASTRRGGRRGAARRANFLF